ncbi:MAG: single-stranded DNA-binding protein [Methylococcaceae bacterium]|jgi:single-strand DNA-binding protein
MSLNLFQAMGNLGQDVDIKYLPDGRAVGNFSIACGEKWKDKTSGEIKESTEWIRCVVFGRRAEVISEHFKKGSQIYISGKMRTRMWEKDGTKHYATEIVVDNFQFCGTRNEGGQKAAQQAEAYQNTGSNQKSAPRTQQGNNNGMPDYSGAPTPNYDDFDDDIPF